MFDVKLNSALEKLPVYIPGRPIEEVAREIGIDAKSIIKLASNENALGPSPKAMAAMQAALSTVQLYPDGNAFALKAKISQKVGLPTNQLVFGNGSNELLELISHAFLTAADDAVMSEYCFAVYPIVTRLAGANPIVVKAKNYGNDLEAMLTAITPATRVVFFANPNNPTGTLLSQAEMESFIRRVPSDVLIVVDEAYTEYQKTPPDLVPLVRSGEFKNLVICRTFSKIYGLAGVRIGYAMTSPEVISAIEKVREPFNTSLLAQVAAIAAVDDEDFLEKARQINEQGLRYLEAEFSKMGLEYIPSVGNFILVKVGDAAGVFQKMQRLGVIVRPVKNYNLPEWLRFTVGTPEQNERAIAALRSSLK